MFKSVKGILFLFLLITAAVCSFVSCKEEKDPLIGKWEANIPHNVFASASDASSELYMEYADFSKVYKRQVYEFNEDGCYKITVYVDEYIESYKDAVYEGMRLYYENEIKENGLDVTVDELFESKGITRDSITLDEKSLNRLEKERHSEGKYTVSEGKLYRSSSMEYDVDRSIYIEYEIEKDTLTFKKQIGGNELQAAKLFPLSFKNIS